MDAPAPLLELDRLGMQFGGLRAVDGLSLTVPKGVIFGLIGPNGSGKSTVFNLITGVYTPTAGRVLLHGNSITGLPPHRIAQLGIRRTFQTIRLFPGMTVLENVIAGEHLQVTQAWWQGLLRTAAQRRDEQILVDRAMRVLKTLQLDGVAHEQATALPYGAQRGVELARAMVGNPEMIILDEPAAGLNDNESAMLNDTIRAIRDTGVTVLLVEHDMNVIMNVTDHIAVINFGRLIAQGKPHEIRNDPKVIEAYLGQDDDDADMGHDGARFVKQEGA